VKRARAMAVAVAVACGACAHQPAPGRNEREGGSPKPDEIEQVAVGGNIAYVVSFEGRLWTWDLARTAPGPATGTKHGRVVALARDASVVMSYQSPEPRPTLLEAWEPATGRPIRTRTFPDGVLAVLGVSRAFAVLRLGLPPPPPDANKAAQQVLPPTWEIAVWDLATDALEHVPDRDCQSASITDDGTQWLCDLGWRDRATKAHVQTPALAPDWEPPPDPERVRHEGSCVMCVPLIGPELAFPTGYFISRGGGSAYVAYNGGDQHKEWRLELWTRDGRQNTAYHTRVVAAHDNLDAQLLAAKHDGKLIVTGGRGRQLVVRRPPKYEAIALPAESANAAAFTDDETRFVTGHRDGTLRVWDAATLAAVATARQP